jgi:hypothetical protein
MKVTESDVSAFVSKVQAAISKDYAANFPILTRPEVVYTMGARYARIIKKDVDSNGRIAESGSVHSFVDLTNGDVLKAASYKAPAKHARGNLFSPQGGAESMDERGSIHYRK